MSEPRVIKKYPNRRLYDTIESRYITLADIRRLVVERIDFVVVDKKNNADITRSILLQVIAEQEHLAEPVLSQEFMVSVIRAYGTAMQSQVSPLLESSLKQLMNQQQQQALRERVKSVAGGEIPRARLSSDVMRDSETVEARGLCARARLTMQRRHSSSRVARALGGRPREL
jgi:polyhydroxyalkanoate synthesis repressor PhaR